MSTLVDSQALDALAEALLPRLVARGFVVAQGPTTTPAAYSAKYDDTTCQQFLNRDHLGDSVLDRAKTFFELLERKGEVSSPDLVVALGVKGARSVPANLTNPLKKRARKMKIQVPWTETSTPDGLRTVWRDRDGIALRMVKAIEKERRNRGLV
ncbi:MAG: hypothetical protein MSC30_09895 [Gaiellaceae bacterium MAG52_C11]|nr:hypothetical protein [Candidatus Gaiellasilicea maunaloa]